MNAIQRLDQWSNQHHPGWIDAFRVLLGGILHFKGLLFMWHTADLTNMIHEGFGVDTASLIAPLIAFMHLFFGTLIMIGLGTRVSCAFMIPIVAGAVFFIHRLPDYAASSEMILSIVTLFLLVFFFIEGSGKFSVQYYIGKSRRSRLRISATPGKP